MRLISIAALLVLAACAPDQRLNVVLLTLDTTRADHIGCYGHEGIETPAIDGLAAEGVRYDNAFTVVPVTLPSHLSMMSGTYPSFHGVRENGGFYVPEEMLTLAEILGAEGYSTAAFVGAFPLDSQTGLDQGFDLYDDNYPSRKDSSHPRLQRFFDERPAADVARAAIQWLRERDEGPFFFWSHFFDPHQPLTPPSPYRERYRSSPYDAEIASTDEAIGRILAELEKQDLLDETLVVLTADHGEGLGEHGEMTHALLLYSSTLRVPLIVRDPTRPEPSLVTAPVSTVDIFSTVLDRLGIEIPESNHGVILPATDAEADPDREIVSETLFGRLIYGWSPLYRLTAGKSVLLQGPSERLYDRGTDPGEIEDLTEARAEELEGLRRTLRRRRNELAEGGHGFSRAHITEETRARLAALGYLGSGGASDETLTDAVDLERSDPLEMMEIFFLHNEAQGLMEAGRLELALPLLARAQERDPDNPAVIQAMAQARLGTGDLERAREALNRLLEVRPNDVPTHVLLSRYHRLRGELTQAVNLLERAVDIDPADLSTRLMLAHLLEDAERPADSEAAYREMLELDEGHVLAANGLATLLYRRAEVAEAVKLLERVLERQPYYAPACLNLAVIEHDRGRADRAQRLAERALALRPGYPQALELLELTRSAEGAGPS